MPAFAPPSPNDIVEEKFSPPSPNDLVKPDFEPPSPSDRITDLPPQRIIKYGAPIVDRPVKNEPEGPPLPLPETVKNMSQSEREAINKAQEYSVGDTAVALGRVGKAGVGLLADITTADENTSSVAEYFSNTLAAIKGEKMPIEALMEGTYKNPLSPVPFAYKVSSGLLETAPKLAATLISGPASPAVAGYLFGYDEQGKFHPANAVVAAALPIAGKWGGGIAETVAGDLGVDSQQALSWINGAGRYATGNAVIATQQALELAPEWSKMTEDEKKKAIQEGAANMLVNGILSLGDLRIEKAGVSPEIDAAARKALSIRRTESGQPIYPPGYKGPLLEPLLSEKANLIEPIAPLTAEALKETAKTGEPNASEISKATEVHGNVQPLSESPGQLPVKESVGGVQPQTEGGLPEEVSAQPPSQPSEEQIAPNARIISPFPIKESYGSGYSISFHVDPRDAAQFTTENISKSIPESSASDLRSVTHFSSDRFPTRVELKFNSKESAQKTLNYLKGINENVPTQPTGQVPESTATSGEADAAAQGKPDETHPATPNEPAQGQGEVRTLTDKEKAKAFDDLVNEHAERAGWTLRPDIFYADPGPQKTQQGSIGITARIMRDKEVAKVRRVVARELGLDPDKMGSYKYRGAALDALKSHIDERFRSDLDHPENVNVEDVWNPEGKIESIATPKPEPSSQELYGVSEKIRQKLAETGRAEPVPPGEGVAPKDSVEHGRELLASGTDPEKVMSDFENTKRFSAEDIAAVRAHGENLMREAVKVEKQFGIESKEYKAARKTFSDWMERIKPMQTEWAKGGHAQQGATDIDTGSFTGLSSAYKDISGKDFNTTQTIKAKDIAKKVTEADAAVEAAKQNLFKQAGVEPVDPKVKSIADRIIASLDKTAASALERIKARRGRLMAGLDPTDLADHALYGAAKIAKGLVEFGKWSAEMVKDLGDYVKPHLQEIFDEANKKLDETVAKAAPQESVKSAVKKRLKPKSDVEEPKLSPAEQKALDAAHKTVREAAVKRSKVEQSDVNKGPIKDPLTKSEQKALERAQKTVREAAIKAAKEAQSKEAKGVDKTKMTPVERARYDLKYHKEGQAFDQTEIEALWNLAKVYLDTGTNDFDDIRNKMATDLGLSVQEVSKGLTQNQSTRKLVNEVWKKQRDARRLKADAKIWLRSQNTPMIVKLPRAIMQEMFNLKVLGHLSVGLGTHAPALFFQPNHWGTFFRNYGNMWRLGLNETTHEVLMQDLQRRENWTTARRAGLENDPFAHEEYQIRGLVDRAFPGLSRGGNRAYDALKILRQDVFDSQWEKLPESMQTPEMAASIADSVNHVTGIVKNKAPLTKVGSQVMFAPRLLASRWAWLYGDPAKALSTAARWESATPEQKHFAQQQLREKATVLATMGAMLVANQAILTASGSDQKINFDDPTRSDFLKFKGFGVNVSFGNAMLTTLRLPFREAMILYNNTKFSEGKKRGEGSDRATYDAIGEYFRNQLNPAVHDVTDIAFQNDAQGRPLPFSKQPVPKYLRRQGVEGPYTWGEYARDAVMPIPLEESVKQVFNEYGMPKDQAEKWTKILGTAIYMGGTGGRVEEDRYIGK